MAMLLATCAATGEFVHLHYTAGGRASRDFPCVCGAVHPAPLVVPGVIDRVSRSPVGEPQPGDARFCPSKHVASYDATAPSTRGGSRGGVRTAIRAMKHPARWRCPTCGWTDPASRGGRS